VARRFPLAGAGRVLFRNIPPSVRPKAGSRRSGASKEEAKRKEIGTQNRTGAEGSARLIRPGRTLCDHCMPWRLDRRHSARRRLTPGSSSVFGRACRCREGQSPASGPHPARVAATLPAGGEGGRKRRAQQRGRIVQKRCTLRAHPPSPAKRGEGAERQRGEWGAAPITAKRTLWPCASIECVNRDQHDQQDRDAG
jgi:hypothetical protein